MTKRKSSAITKRSQSEAAKRRPQTWKPGQSGNPRGAPKRGQSWKEIIKQVGDLTPKEASDYCHAVAARIESIGNSVTLKEAVILRVYAALLFEPDARLLNVIIDRDEGKVALPVTEIPWREYVRQLGYDPDLLMREAEKIVNERFAAVGVPASSNGSDPESVDETSETDRAAID